MGIHNLLHSLNEEISERDSKIKFLSNRNSELIKVVATVRSLLEKSLKHPTGLNQSVYDSIDLCRASFSYMDYSSGKTKRDPPLAETDKILP